MLFQYQVILYQHPSAASQYFCYYYCSLRTMTALVQGVSKAPLHFPQATVGGPLYPLTQHHTTFSCGGILRQCLCVPTSTGYEHSEATNQGCHHMCYTSPERSSTFALTCAVSPPVGPH